MTFLVSVSAYVIMAKDVRNIEALGVWLEAKGQIALQ